MHRLRIFLHYIVCNIYDIVNRTDSACCQSALHPLRRWFNLNILYHARHITGTQIRCLNFNGNVILCLFIISTLCYNRRNKWFSKCSCCFSCNTKNTKAVHTVTCYFILKIGITKSKQSNRITANRCIFIFRIITENINTILCCIRIKIS